MHFWQRGRSVQRLESEVRIFPNVESRKGWRGMLKFGLCKWPSATAMFIVKVKRYKGTWISIAGWRLLLKPCQAECEFRKITLGQLAAAWWSILYKMLPNSTLYLGLVQLSWECQLFWILNFSAPTHEQSFYVCFQLPRNNSSFKICNHIWCFGKWDEGENQGYG